MMIVVINFGSEKTMRPESKALGQNSGRIKRLNLLMRDLRGRAFVNLGDYTIISFQHGDQFS
jgi:hypothetical protein